MADFDFSTLITDRSAADLELLRDLLSTPMSDWTAEQLAAFNQAISKGAYNYTDLNRVTACMEYLDETLRSYGYRTGYQRIIVPHTGGGGSVLPEGYTELEYIESTGSQWIDTQVIPGQADFQIKMDVQSTADASAENWFMTMNQATPAGVGAAFLQVGTWSSKFALHLTAITVDGADAASTDRKTVTLNAQGSTASLTVDSVYTVNNASFATGSYRNYPITFFTDLMRGYAFKINVGDALVRDYIPCTNLSGEAGLYDLVNGQFYGNVGTGDFIAGPAVGLDVSTLLLLHGDTLKDSSIYDVPITNNGVTVSQEKSKFGGSSLYFNGSSAYLMADISVSGDATIDFWMFRNDSNLDYPTPFNFLDGDLRGLYLHTTNSQTILGCETSNNVFAQDTSAVIPAGSWHHIAVVRTGTTATLYIDGISVSTISFITTNNDTLYIGVLLDLLWQNRGWFSGYIDEFRVSDVARWTSNFTPPTEPYNDGNSSSQEPTLDPYTWYEADIPTVSTMEAYLGNVAALRSVLTLPEDTAQVPGNMAGLTPTEANQIEEILTVIGAYLEAMVSVFRRCGAAICGGPGFYFLN